MASDVVDPMVGLTANWKTMQPGDVCEQLSTALGTEMMGKVAESYLAKNKQKAVAAEMEVVPATVISEFNQQKAMVAEQTTTIAELKATVALAQKREFNAALAEAIAAVTPCPSSDPELVAKTGETRTILEMKARAKLGESLDTAVITETVQAAVTDMPALMEMWRDALMGPSAVIVGKDNHKPQNGLYKPGEMFDEQRMKDARASTGIN